MTGSYRRLVRRRMRSATGTPANTGMSFLTRPRPRPRSLRRPSRIRCHFLPPLPYQALFASDKLDPAHALPHPRERACITHAICLHLCALLNVCCPLHAGIQTEEAGKIAKRIRGRDHAMEESAKRAEKDYASAKEVMLCPCSHAGCLLGPVYLQQVAHGFSHPMFLFPCSSRKCSTGRISRQNTMTSSSKRRRPRRPRRPHLPRPRPTAKG